MNKAQDHFSVMNRAVIYASELEYLARCVTDYPDIETGGDLFGFWTHTGQPVIQYAIGPGKKAGHHVAFFTQDEDFLRESGELQLQYHALQHIGEWHSHHRLGISRPSSHDCRTIRNALPEYRLNRFLLCIATIDMSDSVSVGAFGFHSTIDEITDCAWVTLPGVSPIRSHLEKLRPPPTVYQPRSKIAKLSQSLSRASLAGTGTESEKFAPPNWFGTDKGKAFLSSLIQNLKTYDPVCRVKLEHDNGISLTIANGVKIASFLLPHNYPASAVVCKIDGIICDFPHRFEDGNKLSSTIIHTLQPEFIET